MDHPQTVTACRGVNKGTIPAGTTTDTTLTQQPGRLCRVLVTDGGKAGALSFYDGLTAAGVVIGIVPGNAATGTLYDFGVPADVGITAKGGATTPGVTVTWE